MRLIPIRADLDHEGAWRQVLILPAGTPSRKSTSVAPLPSGRKTTSNPTWASSFRSLAMSCRPDVTFGLTGPVSCLMSPIRQRPDGVVAPVELQDFVNRLDDGRVFALGVLKSRGVGLEHLERHKPAAGSLGRNTPSQDLRDALFDVSAVAYGQAQGPACGIGIPEQEMAVRPALIEVHVYIAPPREPRLEIFLTLRASFSA